MMHGHERSRSAIVAVKPTNKAERTAAEPVERRAETKGNADQQRTRRTQRRISVSKILARIRQHIVAVDTQGGNRMRESCTYGSVRGARGNSRPYRRCVTVREMKEGPSTSNSKPNARSRGSAGPSHPATRSCRSRTTTTTMPVHLMAAQALSVRLSGGGALVLSCQYSLGSHGFL